MQEKQKRMAHQAELTASLLERVPRSFLLAEVTNAMPAGAALLDFSLESRPRSKPAAAEPAKNSYEARKAARQKDPGKGAISGIPAAEPKLVDVNLKMTGIATTDVQVAQFLSRLSRSPLLKDVNLVYTEEMKVADEKVRKFQIEMMLNPAAEVQASDAKRIQTTAVELKDVEKE